ncbi:PrgI family protein [Lentzea sp. JNUCC 0626]|uniref:PrgI family protein n=1 Tax=Lentzea sp. JNUCC 0626 TaxID=3367513 RepID=UPI0037491DAA
MTAPVRIPADVDMHDRVLGPLTARQLTILAAAGTAMYLAWLASRAFVPLPLFLVLAVPFGTATAIVALGKRDGVPMDQLLLAAIRQRLAPRQHVAAPEGVRAVPSWLADQSTLDEQLSPSMLHLPAEAVTDAGVVDLGPDGLAVVAAASTVNFALRTPMEQDALVGSFARYLHSLTAHVQILVRTERLDLSSQINDLRDRAPGLPHPALEAAALEHADYLVQLAAQSELLRRQVLLVLREPVIATVPTDGLGGPGPLAVLTAAVGKRRADDRMTESSRRAAESRLVRRLGEAIELLAPAGIVVTPLDAAQATAVLASACNPDSLLPPSVEMAAADDIITAFSTEPVDEFDERGRP